MTESKDFKIDELGLYQTRDGIQTYISFIDPENNRAVGIRRGEADWRIWELNGQYFSCGESGLDVVDRWKTKSEYEESKTKVEGIEQKIDSWLNKVRNEEIECSKQVEYLLSEAKTYIQSLNGRIRLLLKVKGWKAESKIDSWLSEVQDKEIKYSTRQCKYLLREAKTYIQSLNHRAKI